MLESLSLILLVDLAMAAVCQKMKMPRIVGMLISGVVLGPYVLGWLDSSVLDISAQLRQIALVIILIKAGLSLSLEDLKKVGRPAVMMSFVPASCEILAYVLFAPSILKITRMDSAIMGAVLAAVSPAVVVPRMVYLIDKKYGTKKGLPQLILAGASCDDIFVVVMFGTFINMAQGDSIHVKDFVGIPISILLGILLGGAAGLILHILFEKAYVHGRHIRNSMKVIIILGVSFLLIAAQERLKNIIAVSGLLAVMSMACVLKLKSPGSVSQRLSQKFSKLWLVAEVFLFVLVGAAVDVRYTFQAGFAAAGMVFLALVFRAIGVMLCMVGTKFNLKERLFCVIAYLPKATVQAAIGSIPLSLGLPCGKIVLSVAVLSIIITASIGAFGIDVSYRSLLESNAEES